MNQPNLFTRRAFILGLGQGLLFSTIIGRLYYLQILSKKHFQMLSDKNRIHTRFLTPPRGQLTDGKGIVLATSHKSFNALADRTQVENWEEFITPLSKVLNLSESELQRILQEKLHRSKLMPLLIKPNLSWEEVSRLELALSELPGLFLEEGENRYYPYAPETCHIIGYVGAPSESDIQDNLLFSFPEFQIGKTGIEKTFEEKLRGQAGVKHLEVNANRQIVRELDSLPGTPGQDIQLSIDLTLQKKAYELLSTQESGVIILLDCQTGKILTMVSYPGFDSNLFTHGISHEAWQALLQNPKHPLIHKAIAGQYAPGSTFKLIVALAALEKKAIDPQTTFNCPGYIDLGQHRFHCWQKHGHGTVNLSSALMHSCDVFFYQTAALAGIDAITNIASKFGFGELTGIEIPGEKKGLIPNRNWKDRLLKRSWQLGDIYNLGIGQGRLLSTPLQLAAMTAAIANGKVRHAPSLLNLTPATSIPLEIPPEHIDLIHTGMFRCINEPGGTGYAGRITQEGFELAGKTGTSQVRRITQQERQMGIINRADRPWETKEHGLFIGYAPVSNPRFAVCILIEHIGSSKYVVPIARDFLLFTQSHRAEKDNA